MISLRFIRKCFKLNTKGVNGIPFTPFSFFPTNYPLMLKSFLSTVAIIASTTCFAGNAPAKGSHITFDENTRYSQLVIDSRLNDFYANTTKSGFGVFNDKGEKTIAETSKKTTLDYVPGLVAKAVIEAVDYYKDCKDMNVKPWFYAVQHYGLKYDITSNGKVGKSFDDLNAVKLYFTLKELAEKKCFADGDIYSNATTIETANKRFADALAGIKVSDEKYSIKESTLAMAAGGWWHKSGYVNQMWCDGQYMGPALLAQMNNCGYSMNKNNGDWDMITRQFSISWDMLWDAKKELLWHAFTADPLDNASRAWAGISNTKGKEVYHSEEYWGRAAGWYFLALVDVLEQMQIAGLSTSNNYTTLRGYLNKMAVGLEKRQDKTGCWYQLLAHDGTFYADKYKGNNYTKTYNYLESSATAIFIAAYLKGMRLGLYDKDFTNIAKKGYKGFVEQFMIADGNGGVHMVNCCRSAGLGGNDERDGSAAYYLLGPDVSRTTDVTEGKVLGAFILAATEYERMKDAETK